MVTQDFILKVDWDADLSRNRMPLSDEDSLKRKRVGTLEKTKAHPIVDVEEGPNDRLSELLFGEPIGFALRHDRNDRSDR